MAKYSFEIRGNTLEISEERDEYNSIFKVFSQEAQLLANTFVEEYNAQCKSTKDIAYKTVDIALPLYEQAADYAVKFLMDKKVYSYDTDRVKSELLSIENFQQWYTTLAQKYQELSGEKLDNQLYIADTVFFTADIGGPVGAYDGVTTAISLLDAAVTASNNNAELKRIFKDPDTLETFRLAIIVDVVNMHESCMKVLEKEGKATFEIVSEEDKSQSKAIISNLFKGNIPSDSINEVWFEALKLNPYNLEVYRYGYINFIESISELDKIAVYSGIDAESIKKSAINGVIDFNAVVDEQEAISSKEKLLAAMNTLGLESCGALDKINEIIADYEEKAKQYFGQRYSTREECDKVKEQDNELAQAITNMPNEHSIMLETYNSIVALDYDPNIKAQYINLLQNRIIQAESSILSELCANVECSSEQELLNIKNRIVSSEYNQELANNYIAVIDNCLYKIWAIEDASKLSAVIRNLNVNDASSIKSAIDYIEANGRTPYKQEFIEAVSLFNAQNIQTAQGHIKKKGGFFKQLINSGQDLWDKMTVRNSAINKALIPDGTSVQETPYSLPGTEKKSVLGGAAGKFAGAISNTVSGALNNTSVGNKITGKLNNVLNNTSVGSAVGNAVGKTKAGNAMLDMVNNNKVEGISIPKYQKTPAMEKNNL